MTIAQFFGCGMIAFGTPLVMFVITIAHCPIRTIMLVASAFFWLLALLFSSILYIAVVPLREMLVFGAIFSVFFQELFRFIWFIIIKKAEGGLKKVSDGNLQIVENKHILAYVSGLGFGMMSGAFSFVNVLADMTGPGTIGLKGDPQGFFTASAFTSLAFIIHHVFWGIIFFNALHFERWLQLSYVITCHMLVSCITLLNPWYSLTIPVVWILTIFSGLVAFVICGGSTKSLKNALCQTHTIEVSADEVTATGIRPGIL